MKMGQILEWLQPKTEANKNSMGAKTDDNQE
jgi:hypothetical protein